MLEWREHERQGSCSQEARKEPPGGEEKETNTLIFKIKGPRKRSAALLDSVVAAPPGGRPEISPPVVGPAAPRLRQGSKAVGSWTGSSFGSGRPS